MSVECFRNLCQYAVIVVVDISASQIVVIDVTRQCGYNRLVQARLQ